MPSSDDDPVARITQKGYATLLELTELMAGAKAGNLTMEQRDRLFEMMEVLDPYLRKLSRLKKRSS